VKKRHSKFVQKESTNISDLYFEKDWSDQIKHFIKCEIKELQKLRKEMSV